MRIPLDRDEGTPLFRQVERWLRAAITDGALAEGARLPSTRALATELGVSRITIATAYAELEAAGLLTGRQGSGSYVAATAPPPSATGPDPDHPWPLWQLDVASQPETAASPAAGAGASRGDGVISFTGVMDLRRFPLRELARTVTEVLRTDGMDAADYGAFDRGHAPLRRTVAELLASQGIRADPERVLITGGSQQALALTCGLLVRPGDAVVVEQPTYDLALELFRDLGARVVGVPVDDDGMRVDLIEPALQQHHPKLIYTIPNFQNPTGATLSGGRRRELLELAARYNVAVVEDDFAGDLRYDGRAQPAIKSLDGDGHVIYLGTFSKLLLPALRVGYLVADGPILERLTARKRVHDLTTSPLLQRVVDRYVTVGRYQAQLRRSTRYCRARRDALVAAVRRELPDATLATPRGGLFAWLELPDGVDTTSLLPSARARGVEYAAGARFFADPSDGVRYARLNFATRTPEEIDEGIARLAAAME